MEKKLKQGTIITVKHESGHFWKIDDTVVFTDTPECGFQLYDSDGKKLYFPKNNEFSGCGFCEDLFETII